MAESVHPIARMSQSDALVLLNYLDSRRCISLSRYTGEMGMCLKLLGLVSVGSAIGIGVLWHCFTSVPDLPDIPLGYWGPGAPKKDDSAVKPFTINISEADVKDFEARLDNTRNIVEPLEGIGFQYGFNSVYLKKVLAFWKNNYKWSERQTFLNKYPQFKTQIAGLNIHFIHVKPDANSKGKKVVPVILLHGWPGSVREFYESIPMLTGQKAMPDVALELVIPSLPGYGWSDAPRRPGMGPAQIGNIFTELMKRLGHDKFFIQGGDWGSVIGSSMALLHPQNVIGYHSNMCFCDGKIAMLHSIVGSMFPSLIVDEHMVDEFPGQFSNIIQESGYFHIQATKPDTVGVGLTDSPAGLAAYIIEKFSTWTNKKWRDLPDGGLENWDKTGLLDNIMIYWFSNSITTSMRLYSEGFSSKYRAYKLDDIPVTVPSGCARFDNEVAFSPTVSLRHKFTDLVQIKDYKGGHFAAFEVPKTLTDDLVDFIKTVLSRKPKKE
ncbi:hypothetical protein GE061_004992 [Apolygus lucorum]|uniref:microsomal epoxide hydrolase n=1 Tax=Apolygus lucorum TaxID=248454 RepID=A0A8S9WWF3_APOLU|nr:hypothetical protein GE061_004992 [Apolygus lucorum]